MSSTLRRMKTLTIIFAAVALYATSAPCSRAAADTMETFTGSSGFFTGTDSNGNAVVGNIAFDETTNTITSFLIDTHGGIDTQPGGIGPAGTTFVTTTAADDGSFARLVAAATDGAVYTFTITPDTAVNSLSYIDPAAYGDTTPITATLTSTFSETPPNGPGPSVPEPSTLLLVGSGLAGLAGARWRRHRRK